MKTIVRTFAVALVLTGAIASAHTKSENLKPTRIASIEPTPTCPPDDPNACGI